MLLVLDEETITLLSERRPLKDFRLGAMACLRVLAEHGGKPVERAVILQERKIQTDTINLKCQVCRLNKKLKEWGKAICEARGCDEPDCVNSGFIKGLRAPRYEKGKGGPYQLALDPSRVLVRGPRPAWMSPLSNA
jgi:hypothetical protein